jgi:hypothetical protein
MGYIYAKLRDILLIWNVISLVQYQALFVAPSLLVMLNEIQFQIDGREMSVGTKPKYTFLNVG